MNTCLQFAKIKIAALAFVACLAVSNIPGQTKSEYLDNESKVEARKKDTAKGKAYSIGETIEIDSEVLSETRSIIVSVPPSYKNQKQKYPVLYVLDGRNNFLHTTATARFLAGNRRIPELIIVAVNNTKRTRDLTPKSAFDNDRERFADLGGADNFHQFLDKELIPFINDNYRTTEFRALIGHSFGGLFAFHLLQNHPDAFNSYLAISPSLWWNDQGLVKSMKEKLKEFPERPSRIFFTLGDEKGNMIESIEAMRTILTENAPENLKWKFQLLDDESHSSAPLRSTYRGLEFLMDGIKTQTIKNKGGS